MTLKIQVNGVRKRIITPLVTFINGEKVRLDKGVAFVNGEKVQLWGNTFTELETLQYRLTSFSNDQVLYLDNNRLLWHGTVFIPVSGGGGNAVVSQSDTLTLLNIEDTSTQTKVSQTTWGANPIYSPDESSATQYVYYLTNGTTRNRVVFREQTGDMVVSGTYTIGTTNTKWCVPLSNGKNLWVRSETRGSRQTGYYSVYFFGYNSTQVGSTIEALSKNIAFDNGDFVVGSNGKKLYKITTSAQTTIYDAPTYITSKLVDGDNIVFAGKVLGAGTTARIVCCDKDGNLNWEHSFDSDRIIDVVGESDGFYYVVDKPVDSSASDFRVYLRTYSAATGVQGSRVELNYETADGALIYGWKVFPEKTKNGLLWLWYSDSTKTYLCKIYV